MNIFATSQSAVESAKALDDVRLNKMITETAQMLSTALFLYLPKDQREGLYKPLAPHPCIVWARATRSNFYWLCYHGIAMEKERRWRGSLLGHGAVPVIIRAFSLRGALPNGPLTPFHNSSLHSDEDVCRAYRKTMRLKWANDVIPVTWRRRGPPAWKDISE